MTCLFIACSKPDIPTEPSTGQDAGGWGPALLTGPGDPGDNNAEQQSAPQRWSNAGKSNPGLHPWQR